MPETQVQCPEAQVLAAFVEGRLNPAEHESIKQHVAHCDDCIFLAGEAVAGLRVKEMKPVRSKRRGRYLLLVAALALMIVGAITLLQRRPTDPWRQLIALAGRTENRAVGPRLNGFPYRPVREKSRSPSVQEVDFAMLRLRAVAAELLRSPASSPSPQDLHLRGVAFLLAGDPQSATVSLRQATEQRPEDAGWWSDLAAARLAVAENGAETDARVVLRALAAADYALRLEPRHLPALFNRALAIESLHLGPPARAAWDAYLRAEGAGEWAREARERRALLEIPTTVQLWTTAQSSLESAAIAGDVARVKESVAEYRQQARTWSEVQVLSEWADALAAGDDRHAEARLLIARAVGNVLPDINGETLLRDAVAAIDGASAQNRLRLSRAQRDYYAGRLLHREQKTVEAAPHFERAADEFQRAGSPMSYVAQYYVAICRHVAGSNDESLKILSRLLAATPAYLALRAQVLWQRGTDFGREGRLIESLESLRGSLRLFEELGESINANQMRSHIAATEAALGRTGAAWRMRLEIFRALSESGDRLGLQSALEAAARTEALAQDWGTAHSILTLALDPQLRANHWLFVNSLLWRALVAHRLKRDHEASDDLDTARAEARSLQTPGLTEEALTELQFAEAVVIRERDPARAVKLLDEYIERVSRAENPFLLPEALLERGRAARMLRNENAAIGDFTEAIERLANRRSGGNEFQDAFFATAASATYELVDLLDRRSASERAFGAAEAARARSVVDRLHGTAHTPVFSVDAVRRVIPGDTIVAQYVVLEDRTLIFTLDGAGMRLDRTSVIRAELAEEVAAFIGLVFEGRDSEARKRGERLYGWLIEPIEHRIATASTLVIVADPLFDGLPFGALRNPRSDAYLIEAFAVVMAPSSTAYAALVALSSPDSHDPIALVIGNPAIDRARFPSLSDLPRADNEALVIAREYPGATVLRGSSATRERVLQRLRSSAIIHVASHAVLVENEPARSFFVLAPSGGDAGPLYLHEIAQQSLMRTHVVVLAGCRTSAAAGKGDITSFALAFLVAGSRNTIGTLWDVGDDSAREFSVAFHRAFRSGVAPAQALREIQRRMLHSSPLRTWSAFQIIGTGV